MARAAKGTSKKANDKKASDKKASDKNAVVDSQAVGERATAHVDARARPGDAALVEAKRAWLAARLETERAALVAMEEAAEIARAASTHEEMKPENDKDTRALEAGYLASGQSARAAALRKVVKELAALAPRAFGAGEESDVAALVEAVDLDDDKHTLYFIAPSGGGRRFTYQGAPVVVLTPGSPLGDALVGRRAGESVEALIAGRTRTLEVAAVR